MGCKYEEGNINSKLKYNCASQLLHVDLPSVSSAQPNPFTPVRVLLHTSKGNLCIFIEGQSTQSIKHTASAWNS